MRSEAFLRKYRVLEELLETKYARTARSSSSVVMEYLRDEESIAIRDQLNLCREIRNLITHNAEPSGAPVVEPSEGALQMLCSIVETVKKPLLALAFATSADQLMTARIGFFALRLMRDMLKKGFSHIPVMEDGQFLGVFSVSTIFSFLAEHPGESIDEHTRIERFRAHLPVDRHMTERFLFVDAQATYACVKRAFERDAREKKRVAALLVTSDGTPGGVLLGMITPWDVLGKVQGEHTLIDGR